MVLFYVVTPMSVILTIMCCAVHCSFLYVQFSLCLRWRLSSTILWSTIICDVPDIFPSAVLRLCDGGPPSGGWYAWRGSLQHAFRLEHLVLLAAPRKHTRRAAGRLATGTWKSSWGCVVLCSLIPAPALSLFWFLSLSCAYTVSGQQSRAPSAQLLAHLCSERCGCSSSSRAAHGHRRIDGVRPIATQPKPRSAESRGTSAARKLSQQTGNQRQQQQPW